jgi:hypothetical protein
VESNLPGFNADEVRAGIRLAMSVGLPPVEADRPLFVWDPEPDVEEDEDTSGIPFQWDAPAPTPVAPIKPPRREACAIEYLDEAGELRPFGPTASTRLVLTLLDEEYERVRGFSRVVIGGNEYVYERTAAPLGLNTIGIWQIHVRTDDEG